MESVRIGGIARRLTVAGCFLALGTLGCGEDTSRIEGPTGAVQGKLEYQGEPVPEGTRITFFNAGSGVAASGVADATGHYSLKAEEGDQIPVGSYVVTVAAPSPTANMTPEEAMEASIAGEIPQESSALPAKFQNSSTSGISRDVKEGPNTIDIELPD